MRARREFLEGEITVSIAYTFRLRAPLAVAAVLVASSLAARAQAQATDPVRAVPHTQLQEVIVTARKRKESILNVPVDEQAITQGQLQRMHIANLNDVATLVPGLNLGKSLLSIGTLVSIRGVGTASQDPGVDQSVSLNIDGLSLTDGLAYQSGLFDLSQIEVLKGPQSLFYGKSNTGGVIAVTTADPTDKTEVIATAGYGFDSSTRLGQLILSGPVTDSLKLRLAAQYSDSEGYFDNIAVPLPGTGAMAPTTSHAPGDKDYVVRLTALWTPMSQVTARFKANEVHDFSIDAETSECTDAPSGTAPVDGYPPYLGGYPCNGLTQDYRTVFLDPAEFPGVLNDGVPFIETNQAFGTLELNYTPAGDVTYTSVTGYYNLSSESTVNPSESEYAGPPIGVNNQFHRREFTQEVRANSDFKGPVNFTAGAFYQDAIFNDNVTILGNEAYGLPPVLENGVTPFTDKTKSIYGQARWNIVKRLQLAAGVRWTLEKRDEDPFNYATAQPIVTPDPQVYMKNYSPEVDLTYYLTDDTTVYGAWKKGYKSGSFSTAEPATPGLSNTFGPEKADGGEVGLKSRMLQGRLDLQATAYDYSYSGLQVGAVSPPRDGEPVNLTINAASARTYGLDLDSAYLPNFISGLTLRADVEWDIARYLTFDNAPCWGGQTIAGGCNEQYNPTVGVYTAQNLSGTPLIRAPDWQATVGFNYVVPLWSQYTLNVANSTEISSKYVTFLATDRPNDDNYQQGFAKVDFSVTLESPSDFWEVSAIGQDLNDVITAGNCNAAPLETGSIVANPSGRATASPLGIDPVQCFADPGREVWLQVTVRPLAGG
jgi:iron complex outermembrane recepter protein